MKNNELKEIIEFAVNNEVDSYQFYKDAAGKIADENLRKTFEELADEELKHQKFLEDFLASGVNEIEIDEFNDYKVSESVDTAPQLSIEMNFADAIGLAMKKEEEAMNMYKSLAEVCLDKEKKDLFDGLAKMEQMHKARLEEIYTNASYAEVW